jgi:glutamine synthetase type III
MIPLSTSLPFPENTACLVSYYGHALDEKTPLLRASDAMSREGARLCNLLGMKVRILHSVCDVARFW